MTVRCIILLIGLLATSTGTLRAQESLMRDSLLRQLDILPHDTSRLQTLQNMVLQLTGDLEQCKYYNDMLLAEAELQQNDQYKCEAYYTRIFIAYNTYNTEELQAAFVQLEPLARAEKRYDLLFKGWRCRIDIMILSQDFEQNEKEAKKMLEAAIALKNTIGILEAYQCLGNIYKVTYRKEEALAILEKALAIALDLPNKKPVYNIRQTILFLLEETQNYKEWIKHLNQHEAYLKKVEQESPDTHAPLFLILYSSYLNYFTQLAQWDLAENALLSCQKYYPMVNSPLYQIMFNNSCVNYYESRELYELALGKRDETIKKVAALTDGIDYYQQLQQKADLLVKMHRTEDALPLYKHVAEFRDSLHLLTINKQYEQLKKDFNADQLLIEQATIRHNLHLLLLGLFSAGLLVLAYFIAYLLRSNRFLQRAENEMRAMAKQIAQASEAKAHVLSNISASISKPLNTVVEGSLRIAAGQVKNQDERQHLSTTIRSMSAELLEMINDILDLSRLEAGMMKFDMTDIELATLISNAITASKNTKPNLNICSELPKDTLFMTKADNPRLEQVIKSLLSDVTPGEEHITVTAHEQQDKFLICVTGTVLAQKDPPQNIVIRNEINRMLITHFGGDTYEVDTTAQSACFILPIHEIIRPD